VSVAIHFRGAAREVTGSTHLVECEADRILVDCTDYLNRTNADIDGWVDVLPLYAEIAVGRMKSGASEKVFSPLPGEELA